MGRKIEKVKNETKAEEKIEVEKEIKVEKPKKKTKQQLNSELSKVENDVYIEILNVSHMGAIASNKFGDVYFDLEPGESESITLRQAKEVHKSCKMFKDGEIVPVRVIDERYELKDILAYLRLDKINFDGYEELDALIMEESDNYFDEVIKNKKLKDIKKIAARSVYLNHSEDNDFTLSRAKERSICDMLNFDMLIY